MGDLQCAARFVVVPVPADAAELRSERAVAVLAGPGVSAPADALARGLDVPRRDLDPGSGLVPALSELADEYRGECAAVVVTPATLRALARRHVPAAEGGGLVVEVDADGGRWAPWPVNAATGR